MLYHSICDITSDHMLSYYISYYINNISGSSTPGMPLLQLPRVQSLASRMRTWGLSHAGTQTRTRRFLAFGRLARPRAVRWLLDAWLDRAYFGHAVVRSRAQSCTSAQSCAQARKGADARTHVRPVHLLRFVLLRVLESNFPGDSL